jgi:hypothetical protein
MRITNIFRSGFYNHTHGRQHDNGAEAIGFVPMFEKPLETVTGTGYESGWIEVTQPPQVYHFLNVPDSGIGGLQAGQMFSGSLLNNDLGPIE